MQLSLRLSRGRSHNTSSVHVSAVAAACVKILLPLFITHTRAAVLNNDPGEIIAGIKILLQWAPNRREHTYTGLHEYNMLSKLSKGNYRELYI